MPDATITSTASTFGTIAGTFAADQSTITGTITAITGTVDGSVGVPGPQGPAGAGVAVGGTSGQVLQKLSATNYDTGWLTLPADYITSVTAPLAVASGNLSVNLSAYLPLAGGYITGDIQSNNGSGYRTFDGLYGQVNISPANIQLLNGNVGGGTLTVEWDGITFADGKQTVKYPGASILTGYALESWVTAGFYPLSGNPSGFLTDAPSDGSQYARKNAAWDVVIPGDRYLTASTTSNTVSNGNKTFTIGTGLSYTPTQNITISYDASNHMHGEVLTYNSGTGVLTVDINHHTGSGTYAAWVVNVGGVTPDTSVAFADITGAVSGNVNLQAALDLKADLASPALTGNVTITSSTGAALFITQTGTGNILTLHDQASDTTFVTIDANGKVSTIASEATNGAGFNIAHGVAPTTPVNGDIWTTTSGLFMRQNGATKQYVDLDTSQTINGNKTFSNATQTLGNSTATGTISVASGATISASTKTVNVATGGVSGSTTNITVGPVLGASTTSIGGTTAASTLNLATGATLTATTKAVNIGTNGVAGSTTNIAIGSTTGTSTTTLQGTTNGVTRAVDTNSVALATTAFVVGQAGSATPLVNGTAAVGTSLRYARQDHVHGTDTSRAPLASPTFTGTVTIPAGASIDGYATTASLATYAPLASPTFTGTPTLPTGSIGVTQSPGNNTTALATTAFVTAAVPAFGATADINSPSSTTKAASIANVRDMMLSPGFQLLYLGVGVSGTALSGYYNSQGGRYKQYQNSATSGSYGQFTFDTNGASIGYVGYTRGDSANVHNWSKKIWLSGRCMIGTWNTGGNGDANSIARINLGGKNSFGSGNLSSSLRGIGWNVAGGGSAVMNLQVSNGSTVTTVASSFTPTLRQAFDWTLYSDGSGNVTLYINDSQVATTSAGPTGTQSNGLYLEGVDAIGASTAFTLETFGTKIYHST